jgi:hypothetical protein
MGPGGVQAQTTYPVSIPSGALVDTSLFSYRFVNQMEVVRIFI